MEAARCLILTEDDVHLFHEGSWQHAWEKLGAHPDVQDGRAGWLFRVWAPGVKSVRVVGAFNDWDEAASPLSPLAETDGEIWQGFVAQARRGQSYKYVIETAQGKLLWKADPYAVRAECPPATASVLWTLDDYEWHDEAWMRARAQGDALARPLNIYEAHLGSWRRHGDAPQGKPRADGTYPGPSDPFPAQRGTLYTYEELAVELVEYVRDMGYTHLELLPVTEHPFDGSWGYQPTGYYAATARYGTPQQLMALIDAAHQAGIGVILDWVAGGFCGDAQGLADFNGEMLYEREVHPNWGTRKFDFARGEVKSFLTSNALFWLQQFHADGIRADGVTSMLYLNFGKDDAAPRAKNRKGGEEDLDAVSFIRQVNTAVARAVPDALMIAEESTAWPNVTRPAAEGGLGFTLKWDMGWMNDTLKYMGTDFPWRPGAHGLLTFSMMYAFDERFVLPLSHDEVVHGKKSLIGRMPGDWWRQFADLRLLALYQMTHPGAKLTFMGAEIAQFIEWRYYESIEWFLAEKHQPHERHQTFTRALNRLYREEPALWEHAYDQAGFEWIDPDDAEESTITFVRHGNRPEDDLIVALNFDPATREDFRLGVPAPGTWRVVFDTDRDYFGGTNHWLADAYVSEPVPCNGRAHSLCVPLPSLAGLVLKRVCHPERSGAQRNGVEGSSLVGGLSAMDGPSSGGNAASLPLPETTLVAESRTTREDPSTPFAHAHYAQDDKSTERK